MTYLIHLHDQWNFSVYVYFIHILLYVIQFAVYSKGRKCALSLQIYSSTKPPYGNIQLILSVLQCTRHASLYSGGNIVIIQWKTMKGNKVGMPKLLMILWIPCKLKRSAFVFSGECAKWDTVHQSDFLL